MYVTLRWQTVMSYKSCRLTLRKQSSICYFAEYVRKANKKSNQPQDGLKQEALFSSLSPAATFGALLCFYWWLCVCVTSCANEHWEAGKEQLILECACACVCMCVHEWQRDWTQLTEVSHSWWPTEASQWKIYSSRLCLCSHE